ncbi:MAG: hypothetical protein ACLFSE_15980, partial [Spirochaetia bacterium]
YISDIAFKWSDGSLFYGDGTDGADHAFVQALAAQPYIPEEVWNAPSSGYSISDPWHFLKEHVVEAADITVPATTFKDFRDENNLGWLDFQNIGNMFFDQQGQLWGVLAGGWWGGAGDPKPIRLLNSEGNRDLDVVDAFSGSDYKPAGFLMKSNHLYFRDAQVDIDGYEIGYHKILRYDITDPRTIMDDCLQNVPNNGFMEILDFSVDSTNSFLYFTAVSGIDLVIGKVDMVNGFAYTPFDSNLWLSNIEVY